MDPLSIIGLVGAGAKALGGLFQGIGGAAKQRKLWGERPQLGVTAGETANNALYSQMASATEMPGQRQALDKIDEGNAEAVYNAQKSGLPGQALNAAVGLADKRNQAVQDLAGQFAEYKAQRMNALGQWNNQRSDNEKERFQVNKYDPWMMQYGQAVGQKQQGFNSFGSGMDTGLGILGDLQGTKKLQELIEGIIKKSST
jgi:hypothetical protein